MGCGALHLVDGGQLLGDKPGHLLQGSSLYRHQEIVGTGQEVEGFHLGVGRDLLCNLLISFSALGSYPQLNQGGNVILLAPAPVDKGSIAADDIGLLQFMNGLLYVRLVCIQHHRQIPAAQKGVGLYNLQKLLFLARIHCVLLPDAGSASACDFASGFSLPTSDF